MDECVVKVSTSNQPPNGDSGGVLPAGAGAGAGAQKSPVPGTDKIDECIKIDLAKDMSVGFRHNKSSAPVLAWESPLWLGELSDQDTLREMRDWLIANVKD